MTTATIANGASTYASPAFGQGVAGTSPVYGQIPGFIGQTQAHGLGQTTPFVPGALSPINTGACCLIWDACGCCYVCQPNGCCTPVVGGSTQALQPSVGLPHTAPIGGYSPIQTPFTSPINNFASVSNPFTSPINNFGSVYSPFTSPINNLGSVYSPFASPLGNLGQAYSPFNSVPSVGNPFISPINNFGLSPLASTPWMNPMLCGPVGSPFVNPVNCAAPFGCTMPMNFGMPVVPFPGYGAPISGQQFPFAQTPQGGVTPQGEQLRTNG